MRKLFLALFIIFTGTVSFAFYDFCESPQDYNTFPPSYDFKTEYWKDIPEYKSKNIKYKNLDKHKQAVKTKIKIEEPTSEK